MNLQDTEHRELMMRGVVAHILFGRVAITPDEGDSLLAQLRIVRPGADRVAYLSRDGWQPLTPCSDMNLPHTAPVEKAAQAAAATPSAAPFGGGAIGKASIPAKQGKAAAR